MQKDIEINHIHIHLFIIRLQLSPNIHIYLSIHFLGVSVQLPHCAFKVDDFEIQLLYYFYFWNLCPWEKLETPYSYSNWFISITAFLLQVFVIR